MSLLLPLEVTLSAQNLANVTLTLNAATTLPDSTADLPITIAAATNTITAANTVNISNVSISGHDTISVSNGVTLSLSAAQAAGKNRYRGWDW